MKRCNVIIDKRTKAFTVNDKNALSKARIDIERTCSELGFKSLNIYSREFKWRILSYIYNILKYLLVIIRIPWKSNVYIQYPAPYSRPLYYRYIVLISKIKRCNVIYIIHDVESLRFHPQDLTKEISMYNIADVIIVHTQEMKKKLYEMGVKPPMVELWLFDYYIKGNKKLTDLNSNSVAFAGNIEKSGFISELFSHNWKLKVFLYGKKSSHDFSQNDNVMYKGSFMPEEIDILSAKWGLVWDGESISTCSGILGNYLRYNSSHKLSLYIAAGIPVIVWDQSAIAAYVIEKNLGVCISNLKELNDLIPSITSEEYENIHDNVRVLQKEICSGGMFKAAIRIVENILSK